MAEEDTVPRFGDHAATPHIRLRESIPVLSTVTEGLARRNGTQRDTVRPGCVTRGPWEELPGGVSKGRDSEGELGRTLLVEKTAGQRSARTERGSRGVTGSPAAGHLCTEPALCVPAELLTSWGLDRTDARPDTLGSARCQQDASRWFSRPPLSCTVRRLPEWECPFGRHRRTASVLSTRLRRY